MAEENRKHETDNEKDKQAELQETYYRMHFLDQQSKELQQNLTQLDQQLAEFQVTRNALAELDNIQPDTKLFVPISPGIFVKAAIKDTKEVMLNVGSGVTVEKPVSRARDMIVSQIEEIESVQKLMMQQLENVYEQISRLEQKIKS